MEEERTGPQWLVRGKVDEVLFCKVFREKRPLCYCDGAFFGVEGRVGSEDKLRQEIYYDLSPHLSTGLSKAVNKILDVMRLEYADENLRGECTRIHVDNGTYTLGEGFSPMKSVCRHRLPVAYDPTAPEPGLWLNFLSQLLEPMDILTLQEYMGYCLIPTTKGQKMLIITGRGGEGKSRIGVVMKKLLGINMGLGSISKVEVNKFARADLEHLLVLVDDDLKLEALPSTNVIKSIITSELPMDLERKGIQSYQGKLDCRFMAFGNGTLRSQYDQSYGFFRRQIILNAKAPARGRRDDPYLGDRLSKEAEGILLWCIAGLERLIMNDFRFTLSPESEENLYTAMAESNSVLDFMCSVGYFRFRPEGCATTKQLYRAYCAWCSDNMVTPMGPRSFSVSLKQDQQLYCLRYDTHIPVTGTDIEARGYWGIEVVPR